MTQEKWKEIGYIAVKATCCEGEWIVKKKQEISSGIKEGHGFEVIFNSSLTNAEQLAEEYAHYLNNSLDNLRFTNVIAYTCGEHGEDCCVSFGSETVGVSFTFDRNKMNLADVFQKLVDMGVACH